MAEPLADIDKARDAIGRESWAEAYEQLRTVDPALLSPQDLDGFADAAWWLSRTGESIAARQRAYAGYAAGGDPLAANVAIRLCIEHLLRAEPAVAAGWLMRAQRHLREQPESIQHGYLALAEAMSARFRGVFAAAMGLAARATEIGQRFGDRDLVALAIHAQGLLLISGGKVAEGMALLDEAMTSQ